MKKSSELEAHCDLIKDKFKQSCAELGIEVSPKGVSYQFTVFLIMINVAIEFIQLLICVVSTMSIT